MATIIFDFDDTLFDTQGLKRDIFKRLQAFGIKIKVIKDTYKQSLDKDKNYSIDKHVKILEKRFKLKMSKEINEWIYSIDFSSYIFPGVEKFLKKLYKNHDLFLLTKGEKKFQNKKIKDSKIHQHFKKIHIIKNKKEFFLKKNKFNHPIYFINDKKSENKKIKEKFPKIRVIHNKKGGFHLKSSLFD